jgi:hypothetical protein
MKWIYGNNINDFYRKEKAKIIIWLITLLVLFPICIINPYLRDLLKNDFHIFLLILLIPYLLLILFFYLKINYFPSFSLQIGSHFLKSKNFSIEIFDLKQGYYKEIIVRVYRNGFSLDTFLKDLYLKLFVLSLDDGKQTITIGKLLKKTKSSEEAFAPLVNENNVILFQEKLLNAPYPDIYLLNEEDFDDLISHLRNKTNISLSYLSGGSYN